MKTFKPSNSIHCQHKKVVKIGFDNYGNQRYKCASCSSTFSDRTIKNKSPQALRQKRLAIYLLLLGYKPNEIAEELKNITEKKVLALQRKYLPKINDLKKSDKDLRLIKIEHAYKYISALDNGKRPERISRNITKKMSKKSTRK